MATCGIQNYSSVSYKEAVSWGLIVQVSDRLYFVDHLTVNDRGAVHCSPSRSDFTINPVFMLRWGRVKCAVRFVTRIPFGFVYNLINWMTGLYSSCRKVDVTVKESVLSWSHPSCTETLLPLVCQQVSFISFLRAFYPNILVNYVLKH
jgi:hypothetical protein